jgi:TolA-binding protein
LLDQYLKFKQNIAKDMEDLRLVQTQDTTQSTEPNDEVAEDEDGDDEDGDDEKKPAAPAKPKLRTEEQILASLEKNRFALAEYFLLSMQNYDSALASYTSFVETSQDSALKPKSMYSLAYIHKYHRGDSTKADEIHDQILAEYPESVYAASILEQRGLLTEKEEDEDDYEEIYLTGETYLFDQNYSDAIDVFMTIAEDDSGSIWAEKSRYAIAWVYEHKMNDLEAALGAYSTVVEEYPDTDYAKIARNKIKPPPEEPKESADSTATITADSAFGQQTEFAPADSSTEIQNVITNQDTSALDTTKQSREDRDKKIREVR